MDPDTLLYYAILGHQALGIGLKGMAATGITGATFLAVQELIYFFSPKITSQEELDGVVEEEALRLGLNPDRIEAGFGAEADGAAWICDNDYVMGMRGGDRYATRALVKHELGHIANGDCDMKLHGLSFQLYYHLIAEPRAVLYGSFNIQI